MWPYILAAGSTLLEMDANRQAGGAEERAGAEDLTAALTAGAFRTKRIAEKRDRTLSAMRARAGASGVEMAGSALEVYTNAAGQAARDLIVSQMATEQEVIAARERIRAGGAKKNAAVTGGLLELGAIGLMAGTKAGKGYKTPLTPTARENAFPTYGWD